MEVLVEAASVPKRTKAKMVPFGGGAFLIF